MKKYFNDAVIGNKNLKASYTKKGELLRLMYPEVDYRQFVDFFHVGIHINDSNLLYLHDDINNTYKQWYTEDTNILNTEIQNTYFKLKIEQTDFVPIKQNILIKKYKFINQNNINIDLNFLIHSKLVSDSNNKVAGYCKNNTLIQYMYDHRVCVFSKNKIASSRINNSKENIDEGDVDDKDYVGLSEDSSIRYELNTLKPKEEKEIVIFIYIDNHTNSMDEIQKEIENLKKIDVAHELDATKKYWRKYVKEHNGITLELADTPKNRKVEEIYKRTILLYPLLTNYETGGISAAIDVDEEYTECGGYKYCWPRDGVFITKAMNILKMEKETEKFYKVFCKNTQSKSGMWEQRFYTNGRLAPAWGYQIDETASIVYGVYDYFCHTKDKKFLKDNLKMCEKAVKFLEKYIEDVFENSKDMDKSYDLWEQDEGIHLYSLASISAAFESMIKMYDAISSEFEDNRLKQEQIASCKNSLSENRIRIKSYILKNFYDEDKKSFVRNLDDRKIDISILGAVLPFNIFSPKERKILNTIEKMNLTIRTYTGGYQRFENDHYMKGNPWVIATLWMALYYIEMKDMKHAKECFDLVIKTSSKNGFLAEQIDNETMKPAWVVGLAWSHAMFILVLEKLYGKKDK